MRMFPVMVGRFGRDKVWIPWSMVEQHERRAYDNHSQTLACLAKRGGLSPGELADLLMDRKLTFDSGQSEEDAWSEVWGALGHGIEAQE